MSAVTIRRLGAVAALVTALTGLTACGGDDGAGVRELEGECAASGSGSGAHASGSETSGSETSGSETSGSETSGSETSGSASEECETTPSSEGSGSQ